MAQEKMSDAEVSQKSPFAGCAILIAAVAVMLFLVIFSITVLFRQFGEIAKFTSEEPAKVELATLEGKDAEVNQLAEKLEGFRQEMGSGETAVLELNADELNLAIAVYEDFKDLRGMLRVADISDGKMNLEISFQLNGKPRLPKGDERGMMVSDPPFPECDDGGGARASATGGHSPGGGHSGARLGCAEGVCCADVALQDCRAVSGERRHW